MDFISDRWEEADEFEEEDRLIFNRFELVLFFVVDVCDGIVNY